MHIRQTLPEDLESDARLQAYERCPEAVVHAIPEGEMLVGIGAPEVKTIRVREDALVPISCPKDHEDSGTGRQRHAVHLDVLGGCAKHALHGRIIAQSFLDNAGAQGQVVVQRVPPGGVAQQRIAGVAEQVGRRFVAGKEELLHERVQFDHVQRPLALHLRVDQR